MRRNESGAAAVEFALVLPVLLLLVLGIIEFSRAYNAQITLSAAAREGVRVMAISGDPSAATTTTISAAPSLDPTLSRADVVVGPATCTSGQMATVTITYDLPYLTGLFGKGLTMTGTGVMRCDG